MPVVDTHEAIGDTYSEYYDYLPDYDNPQDITFDVQAMGRCKEGYNFFSIVDFLSCLEKF